MAEDDAISYGFLMGFLTGFGGAVLGGMFLFLLVKFFG